jgi:ribosomal silencing factor RsfS
MGRERQELFRESNTKAKEKIIVLAFEGNDTEDIYFCTLKDHQRFNDDLIYLHILGRPKSNNNSSPKHVFDKLKKEAKDEYSFEKGDELWMIIDTDRWKNIPDIVKACSEMGNMYVAVSNPNFELWLLLHIQDIAELSEEEMSNILKNRKNGSKRTHVEKLLLTVLGTYNKSNPLPERFLPYIDNAIARAKTLDAANEEYPTTVGSHVYKVVEKLIA